MNKKYFLITAFIILAIAQIFIPAKMIFGQEDIIETGKEFHFRTEPIDPNDPFRGKYIHLNYKDDFFYNTDTSIKWHSHETAYVILKTDDEGFAQIISTQKEKPDNDVNFLKVKLRYVSNYSNTNSDIINNINNNNNNKEQININYPFDRYYMEETKSQDAEDYYRKSSVDTNSVCYSVVKIKNGEAVLIDVVINDKSIKDIIKEQQLNAKND
jgi:uncharacterized membrane-anchored protein